MANIEYFDDKMKTGRVAVQAWAATGAEIQPARLAGKTRSYRDPLDRFIESVSFGRTHATERDSL